MIIDENTVTINPNSILFKIKDEDMSQDSTKKSDINFNTTENQFKKLKRKFVSKTIKKLDKPKNNNMFLLKTYSDISEEHYDNISLCFFKADNTLRLKLQKIISLKLFSQLVIALIILNSIFLIFETIPKLEKIGKISNYIFTCLFTIEFLMKIIAYGFVLYENSYLRDPWNWLDFIVVITGLLSFFPSINANLFALRTFRLISPLRSIHAFPNMKIFIITLINSLGDLGNIFFLTLFFFIIFGVTGLSLWSEILHYRCRTTKEVINDKLPLNPLFVDSLCGGKNTCNGKIDLCIDSMEYYLNGKIKNKSNILEENNYYGVNYGVTNYHNIFSSIFANIYTYTNEGWGNVMLQFMDGYNYYFSFVFFAFSVIVNYYFMLNLTIAMLIFNFEKKRKFNVQQENFLKTQNENDEKEKKKMNLQIINSLNANNNTFEVAKRVYRMKYIPLRMRVVEKQRNKKFKNCRFPKLLEKFPIKSIYHRKYKITFICYVIYHQPIVQMFFYFCIILNTIILSLDRVDISEEEINKIDTINLILAIIFSIENLIHVIGAGINDFMKSKYNIIDFVIVFLSLINGIYRKIHNKDVSKYLTLFFRIFRIIRMLKLFEKREFFTVIVESIKISVIRMADYILVFLIFLYMFTLLGYSFFHEEYDNKVYNFKNFSSSLITTFSIIIGDRWQLIFYQNYMSKKVSNFATYIYFICILFFGHIILINIFLAYLVENFIRTKRILEKNVNVKQFIMNIYFQVSKMHNFQILDNKKKKKEEFDTNIKSLDKVYQKMNHKKLLMEEEFKFIVRIKIDFTQLKAFIIKNGENVEQDENFRTNSQIEELFNPEFKIETNTNIKVVVFESNNAKNPILDKIDFQQEYINNFPFYKFKIKYWKIYGKRKHGKFPEQSTILLSRISLIESEGTHVPKIKSSRNLKQNIKSRLSLFKGKVVNKKLSISYRNNNPDDNKLNDNNNFEKLKNIEKDKYNLKDNLIEDDEIEKRLNSSYTSETKDNIESRESIFNNDGISSINESYNNIEEEKSMNNTNIYDNINLFENNNNLLIQDFTKKFQSSNNLGKRISIEKENEKVEKEEKDDKEIIESISHMNTMKNITTVDYNLPTESSEIENESETSYVSKKSLKKPNTSYFILEYMKNSSLFIFHKNCLIRKLIRKLVYNWIFNLVILILIILNCIEMCLDNNWIAPHSKRKKILNFLNKFFNIIFLIEAILKIIANDFIWKDPEDLNSLLNIKKIIVEYEELENIKIRKSKRNSHINVKFSLENEHILDPLERHKLRERAKKLLLKYPSYLFDYSNILDFICVCFGTVDLFVIRDLSYFKTLRCFRIIKPIKLLGNSNNLNLMIKCLIKSLSSIGSLMILGGLIMFLFCLISVNLFKNSMRYYCSSKNYNNKIDCEKNGFNWYKNSYNFNNFLYSLSTNFQIMLTENWSNIMLLGELKYKGKWIYLYFYLVIIIGNMIILNLIVGVLIEKFKSIKEKETNFVLLTESEIEWIHVQKVMLKKKPFIFIPEEENISNFKKYCIKIITSKWFNNGIIISMILSLLTLMLQFAYSPKGYQIFLDILNYTFTILFNVEIFLKIYVRKIAFFYLNWNLFDLLILCLCDIMVIINFITKIGAISSIFLIIRCLRTLKLMRKIPYLQKIKSIIDSLSYLVSSLTSVALIMLVVIIIYANVGMSFFGNLPYRKYINNKLNFRNFLTTSILLFQITTKEEWSNFMFESAYHDCKDPTSISYQQDSYCVTYNIICYPENLVNYTSMKKYNMFSCGNDLSYFYFISYMIIGPLFIMNLCIVMVIEGFYEAVSDNEGLLTIDYLDTFIEVWMKYDSQCSNLVKPYEFVLMFKELQPPIGINYDRLIWKFNMNREDERGKLLSLRNFINKIHDKGLEVNDFEHLCNETKNAFEFKDYYISKDMKFNTNDKEVMMLTHKLQINPSELKDSSNEKNIFSKFQKKIRSLTKVKDNIFNDSNSDDSKANELKLINEKFKDYYVHYIEACLALSRFAVSTMCDCTFESLRYNLVNLYTKKMWLNEFLSDKYYISNSYLENKKKNDIEDVPLSEYLASKMLYMKLLKKKIIEIRKKNIEKIEEKEQKNLIKTWGTFRIEKEKPIPVLNNYFQIISKMKENKKKGIIGKQIHFGRFHHKPSNLFLRLSPVRYKHSSLNSHRIKSVNDLKINEFYENDELKK